MKLTSLAVYNSALKKAGVPCELVKGSGYFYYAGDIEIPSVYTHAFNHMPSSIWEQELQAAIAVYKEVNK